MTVELGLSPPDFDKIFFFKKEVFALFTRSDINFFSPSPSSSSFILFCSSTDTHSEILRYFSQRRLISPFFFANLERSFFFFFFFSKKNENVSFCCFICFLVICNYRIVCRFLLFLKFLPHYSTFSFFFFFFLSVRSELVVTYVFLIVLFLFFIILL